MATSNGVFPFYPHSFPNSPPSSQETLGLGQMSRMAAGPLYSPSIMLAELRFNAQAVEHDRRLARRYVWQSALRMGAGTLLITIIAVYVPMIAITWQLGHGAKSLAALVTWLNFFNVVFTPILLPALLSMGDAARTLAVWRNAGVALTPEMMSSRPRLTLQSPLDPISTFDLCAETLSGLALGAALGYRGPAVFWHQPFEGRIVLGPWRPLWLGRSVEVRVSEDPGQPVQVHIRHRFGIDFFLVQKGKAWEAVQTIASRLGKQLEQRDRALKAARRERELERTALQARLSALQAQVEPHFLYNTLANLKHLVRTDPEAAQLMLDHLVAYLQNALPDMRSVSSTLERELALARAYLSIMQIRMGHRLRFRIEVGDDLLALPFPPAMLISLVENAAKHGLERASRPGEIVIGAAMHGARLRVTVRDDGVGLTEQMGQGFGLSNIHERLQLLYGERASLTVESAQPSGVEAALAIPMDVKPE
jgi:signal transduction histidine kinase